MDYQELKKIIKHSSTAFFLEEGEPKLVVMDYQAYKGLMEEKEVAIKTALPGSHMTSVADHPKITSQAQNTPDLEILEKLNQEILALKSQIASEEKTIFDEIPSVE